MSASTLAPLTQAAGREKEQRQKALSLRLVSRLFRYTRPYARKRNALLAVVIIRSIQLPMLVAAIKAVIDGPIQAGNLPGTLRGVAGFALLALFTELTCHFRQRWALELGEWVIHDLRRDIFKHIQSMPPGFFDRIKAGRLISRMTADAEAVRLGVQNVLFITMVQFGQAIVAGVLMALYSLRLFLVVLAVTPVLHLIVRFFRMRLSRAYREMQESFSRVTATLAESVAGVRVTQMFSREDVNAGLFDNLLTSHAGYNMTVAQTAGAFIPALELSSRLFMAVILFLGGWIALTSGHVDSGDLIGFFLMVPLFFRPISVIGMMYNEALRAMAGAERIFELLDTRPDWEDPSDAIPAPELAGRVEFRNVCFSYDTNTPVLHGISFTAEPGQTIAIVGETGSGKTTIINLIAKFYPVTEGDILLDGWNLNRIQTLSARQQMGIVLQQNFLFSGTVIDNIRIGRPEATDEEVRQAAARLDCLDLIEAMPQGLRTPVGEGGTTISLGQRQLICFARAMLANPRILLLDEATSSVDAITEARIQAALKILLNQRTSFVVAHRLSTIRHADCVLVLREGRITEQGTHFDLLRRGGTYAALYRKFLMTSKPPDSGSRDP